VVPDVGGKKAVVEGINIDGRPKCGHVKRKGSDVNCYRNIGGNTWRSAGVTYSAHYQFAEIENTGANDVTFSRNWIVIIDATGTFRTVAAAGDQAAKRSHHDWSVA
jgi:hypothetical protein